MDKICGYITMAYDSCRGRTHVVYIFVITCSLQGEFSCTQVVIIKKGENIEAYRLKILMMDNKVIQMHWSYISSIYILSFWLLKLIQKF